jgi:hypothetical protein
MNHERSSRIAAGIVTFVVLMALWAAMIAWGWRKPQCQRCAAQDAPAGRRQQ